MTTKSKKSNIILIGMPGAGKSTVGVILAKVLGYGFLDVDLLIQKQEHKLLKDIILKEGLEGFMAIENQVNAGLMVEHTVISTGGSVIYGKEAMEHLKSIGVVIYIKLSYETLKNRLGNIKQRGVVLKQGQNLRGLYEERCPMYEEYADIIIDAEDMGVENTIEAICNMYAEFHQ